jgi:radical SAM superfamily enzyme YgiQ (UPF0313 family)
MRCLLLFPPQWIPFNPHLAGPVIHSIIKNHGHEVRLRDLNASFYNTVLTPEFLYTSVQSAFADFEVNASNLFAQCPDRAKLKHQPQSFQDRYRRYEEIFQMARKDTYRSTIQRIASAIRILRDQEAFYDPAAVDAALEVVHAACDVLSATYHPSGVYFLTPKVSIYYHVERLQELCAHPSGNIFRVYYETILPALLAEQPEFIGISLGDYSQLLPGLTLAMLLKQVTSVPLCIGGNLFGRHTDILINNPDFFNVFADFVIYNEGEAPVIELLKHLEGTIAIHEVPNLMYRNGDGRIVINEERPPLPLHQLFPPEYSDLPARDYFIPEPIYNLQTSRSCYWRKCSFCTHHFGSRYAVKPVAQVIAEIISLQRSQQARFFHLIDEAISPSYLGQLSQAIIDAGLDIRFYIYGRFEHAFNRALFHLAYRAGLRMVLWGFESASERVYRLMNKGEVADKNERLQILEAAYAEGVWNFLFLMFGFPTETLDEAKETVDFVRDHRRILSHGTGSVFMLAEGSPILADPERFAITSTERVRNGFNFAHRFTTSRGMTAEQRQELEVYKTANWRLPAMQYRKSSFREKLFLYVCRYGSEQISAMNQTMWL